MQNQKYASVLAIATFLAACQDTAPGVTPPPPERLPTVSRSVAQAGALDRKDTRWQKMSDQEFGAAVAEVAGRVKSFRNE